MHTSAQTVSRTTLLLCLAVSVGVLAEEDWTPPDAHPRIAPNTFYVVYGYMSTRDFYFLPHAGLTYAYSGDAGSLISSYAHILRRTASTSHCAFLATRDVSFQPAAAHTIEAEEAPKTCVQIALNTNADKVCLLSPAGTSCHQASVQCVKQSVETCLNP